MVLFSGSVTCRQLEGCAGVTSGAREVTDGAGGMVKKGERGRARGTAYWVEILDAPGGRARGLGYAVGVLTLGPEDMTLCDDKLGTEDAKLNCCSACC